ncbi:class I SAM-dependent methyltransferase [Parachlamydia sp. AcF125]|uniref:class I SAM-dependent methyltransferase n=1 Tax=Parachlamydia sp. AcF125 TaxID=2795736 RepID=UPI001BC8E313|nr:class I SAM-dependent methyltransferase [Parachlamydia sp. AcF125]MBS4169255.1 Ribosomal RNA large subunit methyltransferase K [Parachlamydia sp. AcF125]
MNEPIVTLPNIADGEDKSSILGNRIRKNYRHIRKWAKRTHTNCFRIYDREIPQYPLTIDFYDGRFCVHYFSRTREKEDLPLELQEETTRVLSKIFAIHPDEIFWKMRAKHKETRQYEKEDDSREFFNVLEYGVKFRINLIDYLDTGLFLDHRETRQLVAKAAQGKRLLNLFAYTCSFSVQAAAAGASFTKSVDMSNTYTAWGEKNFLLNRLSLKNNPVVRADCLKFLDQEMRAGERYDIIVIDPPTISRSKKMDQLFDVQVDYVYLISKSLNLLFPEGVIYFSTNSRKFVFDESCFPACKILEVSSKTLPLDFHDPKIHRCWKIVKTA